ncbi:flagellar basal body FlaE [Xenophilus sp. AP218F]|nr:flagellar hook protein FlgE [Chromobacterium sp. ASV5]OWY37491.1 flagellar basal body FlaE [Xenophilus sp. AP218F]
MSFQQGLSGLNAASVQLETIGNNISNSNTVGFKAARTEFADMYGNSIYGIANTSPGIGVRVSGVTQNMGNGNVTTTGRSLDMAISNNGFFIMKQPNGNVSYSRNGQFQVDQSGYIVNNGNFLQGWSADANGQIVNGPVSNIQLSNANIAPSPTTKMSIPLQLNSNDPIPTGGAFDPTKSTTYNWQNTQTVYDTLGNPHQMTFYYVKGASSGTPPTTPWTVYPYVDGAAATSPASYALNFSSTGVLNNPTGMTVTFPTTNGSSTPQSVAMNFTGSTALNQSYGTSPVTQDGSATGTLTGVSVASNGIIQATYSNGKTNTIGQVALATFVNPQGLQSNGGNLWSQSYNSGPATVNQPNSGNAGSLQSGAVESSNVDLTGELVNMINAQRFYQANAQTIKTQDTLVQTLLSI